jgi:hypothetical protein
MELVSNKQLSSISGMKRRYVGSNYMHFMTANSYNPKVELVELFA